MDGREKKLIIHKPADTTPMKMDMNMNMNMNCGFGFLEDDDRLLGLA